MNIQYVAFRSKRRFGVEIEVNRSLSQNKLANVVDETLGSHICESTGWGYTCGNAHWVVKPDSSCGDFGHKEQDGGGYEVVSPVGHGPKHLDAIERVTKALRVAKARVNDYCGLHVQVDIGDCDDEQAATLLAYWCRIEPIMAHMVPKRRIESHHCKPHTKNSKLWPLAERCTTAKDFWRIMKLKQLGAPAKRNTITLVNYQRTKSHSYEWEWFNRPTVELRFPESSLDAHEVKNWARLFVHFVETCAKKSFPSSLRLAKFDEMLEILGLSAPNADCTILSPGLFETRCWLLHRFKTYARSSQVLTVVSRNWQELAAPAMPWRFSFPQIEKPFLQVSAPKGTTYPDRVVSSKLAS